MLNHDATQRSRVIDHCSATAFAVGARYVAKQRRQPAPERTSSSFPPTPGPAGQLSEEDEQICSDAIAVLSSTAMGLKQKHAQRLVEKAWSNGARTLNNVIKEALRIYRA